MIRSTRILVFMVLLSLQGGALLIWYNWYAAVSPHTPKPSNGKVHVLLLSSWRSGSSFTGEVFSQHPDVFYLMEPGYHVWKSLPQAKSRTLRMALRDELRSLFHCDFSVMDSYLPENAKVSSLFRFSECRALCSPPTCAEMPPNRTTDWKLCEKLCGETPMSQVDKVCSSHSHVVLKEVRVFDVESLYPLFKDPDLDLRIVHLVRDPRPVELSRELLHGELTTDTKILLDQTDISKDQEVLALEKVCRSHVRISETALRSPPPFLKGRYKMIRYEDLVRNPLDEINSIYEFVGLRMTEQLAHWIYESTRTEVKAKHAFDTGPRDAVKVSQAWRSKMPFSKVQRVQQVCEEAMSLLGYKPVNSEAELQNPDTDLLLPLQLPEGENWQDTPPQKA